MATEDSKDKRDILSPNAGSIGHTLLLPSYSVFSPAQKRWIIFIAAWAGWFSTASSFIYFPAIPFMAHDMGVSIQKINLTVTSYMIASGIFPAITGNAADRYGRRVILLASLAVYTIANVGIAVQRSFTALLLLRMLQSAAISGMIAPLSLSETAGKISKNRRLFHHLWCHWRLDNPGRERRLLWKRLIIVCSPQRLPQGEFRLTNAQSLNTPLSVAPMISGLLLIKWTWPSIFWFLSIVSPLVFLIMLLFLPETCRRLVGNGSHPTSRANSPFIPVLRPQRDSSLNIQQEQEKDAPKLPNPFSIIVLLKDRGTLAAVLCYAIYYTVHSCLQASTSTLFVATYHLSGLPAGLIYIPFGVACSIASIIAGNLPFT